MTPITQSASAEPDAGPLAQITLEPAISAIPRAAWDALATGDGRPFDPFVCWDFLEALEASGCVSPQAGWAPRHLVARNASGEVAAVAPMYLKTHSMGEFVFDHAWADAFERAGGRYYPKLLIASPFSPVTGGRVLARDAQTRAAVYSALPAVAERLGVSSLHVNFLTEAEQDAAASAGCLRRMDQQFHWTNRGYRSFEDFLGDLASRKRKAIRKERAAAADGLTIRTLTGSELTEAHWDAFFAFYLDTGARKWGRPYLNRQFFSLLGERLANRTVLVLAERDGRPIAGALNLLGDDAIYGRYWGAVEDVPFLHFELCYYQAIDIAIARGLPRVEAGAQGEHKLARGYAPTPVYSAHWIGHPGFRAAVADYLARERDAVGDMIEELDAAGPFKRGG